MEVNGNPLILRDARAIRLVKLRANAENRSASNSAATTIIEALTDRFGPELNKIQKQLDKIQKAATSSKVKADRKFIQGKIIQ